jgi:glycosyltransferase involved in cell wall biosynthesis
MIIGIDCSRAFVSERTGTENYSYHLITQLLQLPEAKSHTFVLFTRPNALIPDSLQQNNVVIRPIKFRYLWTQLGLAWATWHAPKLDILWVPAHTLPLWRMPGIKTVVTIHGLEYQWLPEYKNLLQRWYLPLSTYYAARSADALIAVSTFTKNQLTKEIHTNANKITVIQEGVETESRFNQPTKAQASSVLEKYDLADQRYILFVGTVQPRKNLEALIEAFTRVGKEFPDLKLVIAGGVGWMAEAVLSAPTHNRIPEKVIFTGRVSDLELAALYGHAQLYVQPSLTEGFGLPVLEAMRWGVPVITSNGGALPETVGSAGLVVQLGNNFVSNLSRAMTQLMRDVSQRNALSAAGKKRVGTLSWRRAAKETLQVLLK